MPQPPPPAVLVQFNRTTTLGLRRSSRQSRAPSSRASANLPQQGREVSRTSDQQDSRAKALRYLIERSRFGGTKFLTEVAQRPLHAEL